MVEIQRAHRHTHTLLCVEQRRVGGARVSRESPLRRGQWQPSEEDVRNAAGIGTFEADKEVPILGLQV